MERIEIASCGILWASSESYKVCESVDESIMLSKFGTPYDDFYRVQLKLLELKSENGRSSYDDRPVL